MEEITVIRAGALGDVVLTLPAIGALRAAYPHARVRVVGYPASWEAAGPLADEVLSIDAPDFADLFASGGSARLRRRLGGSDLVIAWTRHDPTAALQASGIRRVVHNPPFQTARRHVALWTLDTLAPILEEAGGQAVSIDPWTWRLPLGRDELQGARETLGGLGLTAPVVLHPGAGAVWKRWPAERYAALAHELRRRGREVVLVEGPADRGAVAAVQLDLESALPVLPAMGARSLAAVLALAPLFVGNDSGVTHLAVVAGAPTIALFGPTDPDLWRPLGNTLVLRRCARRAAEGAPIRVCGDAACMERISLDEVLRAADSLDVENRVESRQNGR